MEDHYKWKCEYKSIPGQRWSEKICEGLYNHKYFYYKGREKHEKFLNEECKTCKKHMFWKLNTAVLCTVTVLLMFLLASIVSTPEGAIRRKFFAEQGIRTALSRNLEIEKLPGHDVLYNNIDYYRDEYYKVKFGETTGVWKVRSLRYTCWAVPCSDEDKVDFSSE